MSSKEGQWAPGNKNQQRLNRVRRASDVRASGSYGSAKDIARGDNTVLPDRSSKSQKPTG